MNLRTGNPTVRPANLTDAAAINDIYNWYVAHSTITFDIEPWTLEKRQDWVKQLQITGNPYHIFVAVDKEEVVGFAYNALFRPKAAYDSTTEVTIYTHHAKRLNGIGAALYNVLFDAITKTQLHRAYAVISQPNDASVRLHTKFGFHHIGTLNEVGTKFGQRIDVAWFERHLDQHIP